jgi:uncharacterized protein (TIGR04222 family)
MNPFDWRGPQFLLFYLALIAAVLAWCRWRARRVPDSGAVPRVGDLINDPYFIAYLRGGAEETIRIAVFNLIDRGFLEFDGNKVCAKRTEGYTLRRAPDYAVLRACPKPLTLTQLMATGGLLQSCRDYAEELARRGFLLNAAQRSFRSRTRLIAIGILLGTALLKLVLAMRRGHFNVDFLIILAVISLFAVFFASGSSRRSPSGERALAHVGELARRLRQRAAELRPGAASTDALLLASVFGITALPAGAFPYLPAIYRTAGSGGGDGGGGSSCSGGGSCGGGGGCGGCGGCGS